MSHDAIDALYPDEQPREMRERLAERVRADEALGAQVAGWRDVQTGLAALDRDLQPPQTAREAILAAATKRTNKAPGRLPFRRFWNVGAAVAAATLIGVSVVWFSFSGAIRSADMSPALQSRADSIGYDTTQPNRVTDVASGGDPTANQQPAGPRELLDFGLPLFDTPVPDLPPAAPFGRQFERLERMLAHESDPVALEQAAGLAWAIANARAARAEDRHDALRLLADLLRRLGNERLATAADALAREMVPDTGSEPDNADGGGNHGNGDGHGG